MINDVFSINGLKFDFRNKYKYMVETLKIKEIISIFLPHIESYLEEYELTNFIKEKLSKSTKIIHISITDHKKDDSGTHFGCVGLVDDKEMIIVLRIISEYKLTNYFELTRTFLHELFHFYMEGEENINNSVNYFLQEHIDSNTKDRLIEILCK